MVIFGGVYAVVVKISNAVMFMRQQACDVFFAQIPQAFFDIFLQVFCNSFFKAGICTQGRAYYC